MIVLHTAAGLERQYGGPARSIPGLCQALAEQQVSVELFVSSAPHRRQFLSLPSAEKVGINVIPSWGIGWYRWAFSYGRRLQEAAQNGSCLIHDHGLWLQSNQISARVARRFQLPYMVSIRGMLTPWALGYKGYRKRVAWRAYEKKHIATATVLHATSASEAQNLREMGLRQPIAIVPNGIATPRLASDVTKVASRKRRLLFLSRIHPVKGLLALIEALQSVNLDGWEVVLAGPDTENYLATVQAAVRRAKLDAVVSFFGAVSDDEKWALYQSADLFILPSRSENFGIVVAEALAAGVPVITTTGTPWSDLVTHNAGWHVAPNAGALAQALTTALALPDAERQAMGRNGQMLIEKQYGWPTIANQMIDVYRWMLNSTLPMPDCVATI